MRITRVRKLQKCGIFHNFEWGGLPEFAKFNLIYGPTGSGKTTLSRVLRNLELREAPDGEVVISTDELGNIRGGSFSKVDVPVRVFNSDFVKDNVFSVEGKAIPPIIVLGQKSKEKQEQLAEKRVEIGNAKNVHYDKRGRRESAVKDLDRYCRTRSLSVKEMLEGPGDGNNYGNYNKTKYRERAEMLANEDAEGRPLDSKTQKELLALHRAVPMPEILESAYAEPGLAALREKVVGQLSRTVVSGAIGSLRDDPDKAEWVRRGIGLRGAGGRACPFCEQPVPEQRELDLERHFSAEYEDIMRSLDELAAKIGGVTESCLAEIEAPDCEMIYEHLFDAYRNARDVLGSYRSQVKAYLDSLADALARKRRRPFDPVPTDGISRPPEGGPPERLLGIIREHNDTCRNLADKAAKARERLEFWYVAKDLAEFRQLRDEAATARREAKESESRVADLEAEVAELEREISDHSGPADDFNDGLRQYLGHGELRLDVRENGYAVVRDGGGDPLPSEGEKTAIALLYFLTSLKGDKFDMENGVVVLDDPVSSLDANTLFAAYGFVRERAKSAGQLFILTHNFTFFRAVKEWFGRADSGKGTAPRAQFYMLESVSDDQGRHSEIRELDPLLRNYGSDYHYLFARVWRGAISAGTLETNYPLPNMARRLLETFLAFRRPDIRGSFGDRMDKIDLDEERKRRILTFVNTHSHNIAIAEPEHDVELLAEAPDVLSDIMDLMQTMDPEHYASMVSVVKQP